MDKPDMDGVLVLECLKKGDPGSEGRFLAHMFNLMDVPNQYVEIHTKEQFLAMLTTNPYSIAHITTHGYVGKKEEFVGFWTPNGKVLPKDLHILSGSLKDKIVVSTACRSGVSNFRTKFTKVVGCRYYIAPAGSPKFHNAILFAHVFYHKLFILKKEPLMAYEDYKQGYKNPHRFRLTCKPTMQHVIKL